MISRYTIGSAEFLSMHLAAVTRTLDQLGDVFPGSEPAKLELAASEGATQWSFNLPLFRIGGRNILIDTGFSFGPGGPGASTEDLLAEAEIKPDDVDTVVITHGHGDHIGGLTKGDLPAFVQAELAITRAEHSFWTGSQGEERYGAPTVAPVRQALGAYDSQTKLLAGDEVIARDDDAELRCLPIPGHTPGHIGLELRSGGRSLKVLMDTFHVAFQLQDLDWSPRFDVDPVAAAASRKRVVADAVLNNTMVHLYHLPFPGIGRIAQAGSSLTWLPAAPDEI